MRLLLAGAAICLVTWWALLAGAGNVGLQRSVSTGPQTLLEVPLALALVAAVGLVAGFAAANRLRLRPLPIVGVVLAGDVIAALALAPILVGELELLDAPIVFGAVTVLGLQPLAVIVGSWLAARREPGR